MSSTVRVGEWGQFGIADETGTVRPVAALVVVVTAQWIGIAIFDVPRPAHKAGPCPPRYQPNVVVAPQLTANAWTALDDRQTEEGNC